MSSGDYDLSIDRRKILAGIGTAALPTGTVVASESRSRRYVGKSYDPVTDTEQDDADAVLSRTPDGLRGRLDVAGFRLSFGDDDRLTDENNHPRIETYSFVADDDAFLVQENERTLPLQVRIDVLDDRVTGTLTRPSAEYGSVAFSLNPADQGFTHADVGKALHPERAARNPPDDVDVTIPDEGVPTSNSIQNVTLVDDASTSDEVDTMDYIGGGGGGGCSDDDVGFLDEDTLNGAISGDFPDRCSGETASSSWAYEFGTSAEVRYDADCNLVTDYDEIAELGGYKRFQMQAHFSDVPDPYVHDCDQDAGVPYQTNVEFWANQTGGTEQNDASLSKPEPQDSSETSDPGGDIMNLGLDLVNSITGVYGSVASTLIKYALNSDSSSGVTVEYNPSYSPDGNDAERYYWDLPLDGSYQDDDSGSPYFPDHTDNVAGASFKVQNGSAEGWNHQIETRSRFEFGYLDYYDGKCPCDVAASVFKTNKTATVSNIAEYTSVSS